MKNLIKKILIGEAKKRTPKPQPNSLDVIRNEISKYEKKVESGDEGIFGKPVAYFVINTGHLGHIAMNGEERWEDPYRDDKFKLIGNLIERSPYAVHVVIEADPEFYLGLYRRDAFWIGSDMESIIKNMSFMVRSLQGEPVEYAVYRDGEVTQDGQGLPRI